MTDESGGHVLAASAIDDILTEARKYRQWVGARAIAHYRSAEDHRKKGVLIGWGAISLSAIVGTTVFATLASQFGLSGQQNGSNLLPSGGWAWVFGAILILAPVISGWQTFLKLLMHILPG